MSKTFCTFTGEQVRRQRSELRSLSRRAQMRSKLDLETGSVDRRVLSKREASEPSTSSPIQKPTAPTMSTSHSIPSSNLTQTTVVSNTTNPTSPTSNSSASWTASTPPATASKPPSNSTVISWNGTSTSEPTTAKGSSTPHAGQGVTLSLALSNPLVLENTTRGAASLPLNIDAGDVPSIFPKEFTGPESLLQVRV